MTTYGDIKHNLEGATDEQLSEAYTVACQEADRDAKIAIEEEIWSREARNRTECAQEALKQKHGR